MHINLTITRKDSTLSWGGSSWVILHRAALQALRQCRAWGVNSMTKGHNSAGECFGVKPGKKE